VSAKRSLCGSNRPSPVLLMNWPRDEPTNWVDRAEVSMKDKFEPKKSLSSGEAHKLFAEDLANISSINSLV
jgi:hypothetical protein